MEDQQNLDVVAQLRPERVHQFANGKVGGDGKPPHTDGPLLTKEQRAGGIGGH
ncbi:MAG: hypothetical protein ACUVRT_00545 [Armatimonadota bacterium]